MARGAAHAGGNARTHSAAIAAPRLEVHSFRPGDLPLAELAPQRTSPPAATQGSAAEPSPGEIPLESRQPTANHAIEAAILSGDQRRRDQIFLLVRGYYPALIPDVPPIPVYAFDCGPRSLPGLALRWEKLVLSSPETASYTVGNAWFSGTRCSIQPLDRGVVQARALPGGLFYAFRERDRNGGEMLTLLAPSADRVATTYTGEGAVSDGASFTRVRLPLRSGQSMAVRMALNSASVESWVARVASPARRSTRRWYTDHVAAGVEVSSDKYGFQVTGLLYFERDGRSRRSGCVVEPHPD
jgi:hypothetical protein